MTLASSVYRDYVTDGVPSTGAYNVTKADIRALLAANGFLDANDNSVQGGGTPAAGGALTTGLRNFLRGSRAGSALTAANDVIAIGRDTAMAMTVDGVNSTNPPVYIGYTTGKTLTEGGNVGVGPLAAGGNSQVSGNAVYSLTAVGEAAAQSILGSQKDAAFGSFTLASYLRGGQNTALGRGAGQQLIEGSYNLLAGHAAAVYMVYSTETVALGNGAMGNWTSPVPQAFFTGSIADDVLTVTAVASGTIYPNTTLVSTTATGLGSYRQIQAYGTSATTGTGGIGTYKLSGTVGTVASQALSTGPGGIRNIAIGSNAGPSGYNDSNTISIGFSAQTGAGNARTTIGFGQVAAYISGNLASTLNAASITGAGATWTAAQMYGGLIRHSGSSGAISDTTATAAQIVASIPGCEANSFYPLTIQNLNAYALTINGGAGVTVQNSSMTLLPGQTGKVQVNVTNAASGSEAVTIWTDNLTAGYAPTATPSFTGVVTLDAASVLKISDVGLSRLGGGIAGIGNGTAGDSSGELRAARFSTSTFAGSMNAPVGAFFGLNGNPGTSSNAANGTLRVGYNAANAYVLDFGVTSTPSTNSAWIQSRSGADYSINNDLWLNPNGGLVSIGYATTQTAKLAVNGTGAFSGAVSIGNTLNSVSPTSPNRTITMVVGGVTVYIPAKTTND